MFFYSLREGNNSSSFSPSPDSCIFIELKMIRKNQGKSNDIENGDKTSFGEQITSKKLSIVHPSVSYCTCCQSSQWFLKKNLIFFDLAKVYNWQLNSAPEKDARHKNQLTLATTHKDEFDGQKTNELTKKIRKLNK